MATVPTITCSISRRFKLLCKMVNVVSDWRLTRGEEAMLGWRGEHSEHIYLIMWLYPEYNTVIE